MRIGQLERKLLNFLDEPKTKYEIYEAVSPVRPADETHWQGKQHGKTRRVIKSLLEKGLIVEENFKYRKV